MAIGFSIPVLRRCLRAAAVTAVTCGASVAMAGPGAPPNYGYTFATVAHPGNAATQTVMRPGFPTLTVGGVNHVYRIATTEVTNRQWFDFVEANAPFVAPNAAGSPDYLGKAILFNGFSQGLPQYTLLEPFADRPIETGWRYAATFTNWLHNGRKGVGEATAADFANGAYDTSTFTVNPDGTINDQAAHHANARYWIPTLDEWVKAAYWDPNKNGPGQAGYWLYPITSDTAPVAANPANGGTTNAGPFPPGQTRPLDVGSYPEVQSPWGLLDCSGGLREWTETPSIQNERRVAGTTYYTPLNPADFDRLAYVQSGHLGSIRTGFRIASLVPSPGSGAVFAALTVAIMRRRRAA